MPIDRTVTPRNAEKLLRQGRLEQAIGEYLRLVDDQPRDWNTANVLGDLYVRAGRTDKAIEQFVRIADALGEEGFLPRAAALYKKILKLAPTHEHALVRSAEIVGAQGLLADARNYLAAVVEQRRSRGDERGMAEVTIRLAALDPTDLAARRAAARAHLASGNVDLAVRELKAVAAELRTKGLETEAIDALREASRLDPADRELKIQLARAFLARSDVAGAAACLSADVAALDPQLLVEVAQSHLRSGRSDGALVSMRQLLDADPTRAHDVAALGWTLIEQAPDTALAIVGLAVDAAVSQGDWTAAAAALQEYVRRVPGNIPALIRLVEVSVDGGLEATATVAQARLADAYIASGSALEARYIAEDLLTRNPDDAEALERFRRALVATGASDPDAVIADHLPDRSQLLSGDFSPESLAESPPSDELRLSDGDQIARAGSNTSRTGDEMLPAPIEIDLSGVLEAVARADAVSTATPQSARHDRLQDGNSDAAEMAFARGLALEQAGQLDESIAQLAAAARSPRLRFQAASRLARAHRLLGRPLEAIEWFERAAEAPPPLPQEGHTLLYELADTLESVGEHARALAVYLELRADAGDYRDVAARVDRLVNIEARGQP